jgi:hypothetical protein
MTLAGVGASRIPIHSSAATRCWAFIKTGTLNLWIHPTCSSRTYTYESQCHRRLRCWRDRPWKRSGCHGHHASRGRESQGSTLAKGPVLCQLHDGTGLQRRVPVSTKTASVLVWSNTPVTAVGVSSSAIRVGQGADADRRDILPSAPQSMRVPVMAWITASSTPGRLVAS